MTDRQSVNTWKHFAATVPPAMVRTKPAAERRRDLLDAGARIFVTKGSGPATIDDITREAGVSKGAFYLYFQSKDELLGALQSEYSQRFNELMAEAVAQHDDWGDKLDACVRAAYEGFHHDVELHDALFRSAAATPAGHIDRFVENTTIDWMRGLIEAGNAAGAYHVEDPQTTAVLLFVAVHGFDLAFHGSAQPEAEQLVRATQQLFRRTVGLPDLPPAPPTRTRRRSA